MEIIPKFTWNSTDDNLVNDFYRPLLSSAVFYQRKSGYFSSTSFMNVFKEIINFIEKGGRIQLITSPNLSIEDREIFLKSIKDPSELFSKQFFDDLKNDPEKHKHYFAQIMGYMLHNKINGKPQLEIKIALTNDGEGIFHDKSGIIHLENEDMVSFTGSVNETFSGWNKNHENFVAFYSWISDDDKEKALQVKNEFEKIWNNEKKSLRIYELPSAVEQELLAISPKSTIEYQKVFVKACEIQNDSDEISDESNLTSKSDIIEEPTDELRDYQKNAINNWKENNFKGIFSMATGTGKTFTAFGCINEAQQSDDRLVTIISCPMTHLVEQWKNQLEHYNNKVRKDLNVIFDQSIVIYGEKKWRPQLDDLIDDFNSKLMGSKQYTMKNILIYVTHQTANNPEFIEKILSFTNTKLFLIVDEVHNVGTESKQRSLLEEYDYRLGLSATPKRHYDEEGTERIFEYFDDEVFSFSLKEAIDKKRLCPYEYHPIYAELTNEEMEVYHELTRKIAAKLGSKRYSTISDDDDKNDPANKRADLIANAENKLKILENMCNEKDWKFSQTLIYCTSNQNPVYPTQNTQLDKVNELLSNNHVTVKSITYEDPTKSRLEILDNLATGHYNCVTAVKCLDEGMDIPSIETAIMMASSGNPKQYVQRRGRVLRPHPGKEFALIYDILVKPPVESLNDIREKKLVAKELLRHKEFASTAKNKQDAIDSIRSVAEEYQIDLEELSYKYIQEL